MELGRLKPGEVVRVLFDGAPRRGVMLPVEMAEKRRVWLVAADCELALGERVVIERAVDGDARYRGSFDVVSRVHPNLAFEPVGEWLRVQARDFARVATDHLPLEGVGPDDGESFEMHMLDLSTGGMLVETAADLQCGDPIDCRFKLPACEVLFTIPAAVVRAVKTPRRLLDRKEELFGLQFIQLAGQVEAEITRWVFRQQIRKNNIERDLDDE